MYKNLKIGKKLFIGFAVVTLLSVIMIAFALYSLNNVGGLSHQLFSGPYVSTTESLGIKYDLNAIGKDIRSGIIGKNIDVYMEAINTSKTRMEGRITKIGEVFGGDPALVTAVADCEKALNIEREIVLKEIKSGNYEKAVSVLNTSYADAYKKTEVAVDALYDNADTRAIAFDANAQKTTSTALVISLILLGLSLILAIIMAIVSTRSITHPMKQIEDAMNEMAQGSLKIDIDYHSKDELGFLADKMKFISQAIGAIVDDIGFLLGEMADGNFNIKSKNPELYIADYAPVLASMRNINTKLSDTLIQINTASEQVSSGSDQVSSGAQALSQGATEQASSVEELAATINEISEQIKQTATNAKEASAKTNQAGQEVVTSNKKMQDLIAAMGEISNSSQEIGKVIKAIEDIAFQTNILALNAAVEAARAGVAGKGFAVVADEVRNLASKSAEAAKGTTALIENSVNAVEKGTKLADDTAKSLLSVVDGAKEASAIVDKIAAASGEQASSAAQITQGIDQISAVVQTNSATAEESAAASEELSGQAVMLKQLVGQFRLKPSSENQGNIQTNSTKASSDAMLSSTDKY
ncbi:MAG: HAMP domain-containing methyl-accepting chemotaxis protein [Oscillospiraceae bacterium]